MLSARTTGSDEPAVTGPLDGIHVLDITANMSGPFATMVLGDQGADVIKLEPPTGDPVRRIGTGSPGLSAYYANLNRSKRSVAIDLGRDGARPILDRLLDWADVVVHNYRQAAAASLGIDEATVRAGRPQLIHVTITGYGSIGPLAGRPVYDHVIQAMSGIVDRQRDPYTGEPAMVRHGIVDKLTGWATSQAVCAALVGRATTGRGCAVEISMLDVAVATLWPDGMMNHTVLEPERERPDISKGFRVYPTADGHVTFTVLTERQIDGLRDALELDEDELVGSDGNRHRALVRAAGKRVAEIPTDELVEAFTRHDVPIAPVVSMEDLHQLDQIVANTTVEASEHPVLGTIRQAAPVARFGHGSSRSGQSDPPAPGAPRATGRPASSLGADAASVFVDVGLTPADLDRAVTDGVVVAPESP